MALVLRLLVLVIDFPMFSSYTCAAIKKGGRHRMTETKNLCAQIDLALHMKVCEEREKADRICRASGINRHRKNLGFCSIQRYDII